MKDMFKYNSIVVLVFVFTTLSQAQPRIWNVKSLEKAKQANYEAAKYVVREADKSLDVVLTTVIDKPLTPASGDKHDYMSMGRYWWPNPATTNGLPYVRKDGESNPEIEKLDRYPLSKMARNVYMLSLAYYFTSDEKYAVKAVKNLRVWFIDKKTMMNPNMNYGQTIPGVNEGKGRGEGVLDSYSFVDMLDGIELLKSSKKFATKDKEALNVWFTAYLDWMLTSEIGKEENAAKNNHGTAFDVQAVRYALFVGKEDVAKRIVNDFITKRLFAQIEPNGAQPLELARTTALGYSTFNLTHIIDMCLMAKALNIDVFNATSTDGRSVAKAVEFLVPFIGKPQSDFPYLQIKDWSKVQTELCWQLLRVDKFFTQPKYDNYYTKLIFHTQKDNNIILY